MGRQLEELSALKGGWNVILLLPDSLMFDIAQILYKEGMKCTQEKARDRPKMKEVVGHIIIDLFLVRCTRNCSDAKVILRLHMSCK